MKINIHDTKRINRKKASDPSFEKITSILNKDIQLAGKKVNDRVKESFYNQLGVLLNAGVDIKTSLEIIVEEQSKKNIKALFEKIKEYLISGQSLSNALQEVGEFTNYEINSLSIGEESGKIPEVLKELGIFYKNKIKQRRQIISALTYPSIVLLTSFGAIFFMLNFIVPMFSDIFKRFGGKLPFITKVILDVSVFMSSYFYLIFLFILSVIIFIFSQRKKKWFRKWSSELVLKIPVAGVLVKKIYLIRLSNSMKLLIGARIPILRSIELIRNMIEYYPIEESLAKIEADILQGRSLHQSLSKFDFYPKQMISLIKVGEEINSLDYFFDKIATQYSEEVEHQTNVMSSLLEPFIIIFLGLIVGVILIAMYLPLFQLSTVF